MSRRASYRARLKHGALLALGLVLTAGVLVVLGTRVTGLPPLGTLLDPADGLYRTARRAAPPAANARLALPALDAPVTVVRDGRGVPHIFAQSDRDAVVASGYVAAQDRLFQLDFIPRVASGRLASALGPQAVASDRFLRSTGMELGARRNLERIRQEGGIGWDLVRWYAAGVNAYLDALAEEDLPLEFRLLGYRPARYRPIDALRLLQYMTFDLTFRTDDAAYARLQQRLSAEDYALLYPRYGRLFVPIIPGGAMGAERSSTTSAADSKAAQRSGFLDGRKKNSPFEGGQGDVKRDGAHSDIPLHPPSRGEKAEAPPSRPRTLALMERCAAVQKKLRGTLAEGFLPGKGSNNWAVNANRSATGRPILANDMHLGLTLPAIWYEIHLITPTMNTYGVTIPGAPLPVVGFTEHAAWGLTNTGADQIDHLALELDATRTRYRYEGEWRELRTEIDTIEVNGAAPVLDTLYFSHWGPVQMGEGNSAVAINWVAHDSSRTLQALWQMHHARSTAAFEAALQKWDTPSQNILYATAEGDIAIRSTGYLPIRRAGHGVGLLDGSTDAFEWTGRIPFADLPHAANPARGYLTSTNQPPVDSTYGYYLGHDWRDGYRSLRIDSLLSRKPQHSAQDLKRYQADVHAMQRDLFVPMLDTLRGLSTHADTLRHLLARWDGSATVDRPEPLVLETFMDALHRLAWDEAAFASEVPEPQDGQLLHLLRERPRSKWLDVQATPPREDAAALLALALKSAADTLEANYGWGSENWRWGDHHKVLFRHLTQTEALQALWRGPVEYPGFEATLSPARGRPTTHSASWRMVVDFSKTPPRGWGVYPGGQSGSPFSRFYDYHLPEYLSFRYYDLLKPEAPSDLGEAGASRLELVPAER